MPTFSAKCGPSIFTDFAPGDSFARARLATVDQYNFVVFVIFAARLTILCDSRPVVSGSYLVQFLSLTFPW